MKRLYVLIIIFSIIFSGFAFQSENNKTKYAILTSKSLFTPSLLFKNLRSKDFDAKMFFVEDIGKSPAQIKEFLEKSLNAGDYLLIIGDEETIPKGTLYPKDPKASSILPKQIKTDIYYSMLGEDLDKDKDTLEGELLDDMISFQGMLYVGRIPFNDISRIKIVYDNTIKYESRTQSNVVLAGSFISFPNEEYYGAKIFSGDGARELEILKDYFRNPRTLYEKEGSFPSPLVCDLPFTKDNFIEEIKNADLIFWSGHGSKTAAYRSVWDDKNLNGIPDEYTTFIPFISTSDKFYTNSVVFSESCLNLKDKDNLGEAFLLNGSPGFLGSTEISFTPSYFSKPTDGGNGTLGYFFSENLYEGKRVGEALISAMDKFYKEALFNDIEDPLEAGISIIYAMNLYGDPALKFNYEQFSTKAPHYKDSYKDLFVNFDLHRDFSITVTSENPRSFFIMLPKGFFVEELSPSSLIYDSLTNLIRANQVNDLVIKGKIRDPESSNIIIFDDNNENIYKVYPESYNRKDINFDGIIDVKDFQEIIYSFGKTYMDKGFNKFSDMNYDLRINGIDILIFLMEK